MLDANLCKKCLLKGQIASMDFERDANSLAVKDENGKFITRCTACGEPESLDSVVFGEALVIILWGFAATTDLDKLKEVTKAVVDILDKEAAARRAEEAANPKLRLLNKLRSTLSSVR